MGISQGLIRLMRANGGSEPRVQRVLLPQSRCCESSSLWHYPQNRGKHVNWLKIDGAEGHYKHYLSENHRLPECNCLLSTFFSGCNSSKPVNTNFVKTMAREFFSLGPLLCCHFQFTLFAHLRGRLFEWRSVRVNKQSRLWFRRPTGAPQ